MSLARITQGFFLLIMLTLSGLVWAGGATWIDVRTPEEYSQKHVPDAVNIPHEEIGTGISALGLEKNQVIYLYCHSGRRAGIAKQTLDSMGYTRVVNIGGLDDALTKLEVSKQQ